MPSIHAIALLPLILSSIAHPLSPRDDPSTFLQDTDPLVENPSLAQDSDEMFGDSFAIPYPYTLSPSASPSSRAWSSSSSSSVVPSSASVSHSPSLSASVTPVYTPWEPTPVNSHKPVILDTPTPANSKTTKTTPTPTPVADSDNKEDKPTFEDKYETDSFDALWDILSGKIRNVLDSDERTLW